MTKIKLTEDSFLTAHMAEMTVLNLFLTSGVRLSAVVLQSFDLDAIFVRPINSSRVDMIYKWAISTLSPVSARGPQVHLRELEDVISDLVDRAEALETQ